ncbi:Aste57867_17445 [Aphanomyces stellatus]|uniref:Aste57867_17445 protein n=1 Tax=Aphanomyces stellatus TaxID=120398 RepID=A0A485L8N1_9STRA|nr:hypothetical protein As57867_017385 [Aphanomyces stellatus]VFT94199.1 Aste57867_17445 [Aphanomyces stellatus]
MRLLVPLVAGAVGLAANVAAQFDAQQPNTTFCWDDVVAPGASLGPIDLVKLATSTNCSVSLALRRNMSAVILPGQSAPMQWTISFAAGRPKSDVQSTTLFVCQDASPSCATFDSKTSPTGSANNADLPFTGSMLFQSPGMHLVAVLATVGTTNVIAYDVVQVRPVPTPAAESSAGVSSTTLGLAIGGGVLVLVLVVVLIMQHRRRARESRNKAVAMLSLPRSGWDAANGASAAAVVVASSSKPPSSVAGTHDTYENDHLVLGSTKKQPSSSSSKKTKKHTSSSSAQSVGSSRSNGSARSVPRPHAPPPPPAGTLSPNSSIYTGYDEPMSAYSESHVGGYDTRSTAPPFRDDVDAMYDARLYPQQQQPYPPQYTRHHQPPPLPRHPAPAYHR